MIFINIVKIVFKEPKKIYARMKQDYSTTLLLGTIEEVFQLKKIIKLD